jgi:hypothetical protein
MREEEHRTEVTEDTEGGFGSEGEGASVDGVADERYFDTDAMSNYFRF